MANETRTIRIESILGGHSQLTHFAAPDQFRGSLGIDPRLGKDDSFENVSSIASGLLRPVAVSSLGTTAAAPRWFINEPKAGNVYVYDAQGSAYTVTSSTLTELSDGGTLSASTGNGAAYYDNYIYFAKNTTIARYGPLNGTPTFNGDYWVGTLSKTQLVNTNYPVHDVSGVDHANHYLHRHSDGKLYIADVVGNQGTIHYIQTSKTTVEGDTDNGSVYSKLQFGYGLWPTAIESYGSDLVVALLEQEINGSDWSSRAKLAFWDTTSTNFNKITWVEFPDVIITALKNINGVLYVFSGSGYGNNSGFRVSRFIGGYSFEEVLYSDSGTGESPLAGATDGIPSRLSVGSYTKIPEEGASVFSFDLQGPIQGIFNTMRAQTTTGSITALKYAFIDQGYQVPVIGWTNGLTHGIDVQIKSSLSQYDLAPSVFWSQVFRIGQPFKIKKIRLPLALAMASNMIVTPKIYTDDGAGTTYTLTTMNNTNDPGALNIVRRSGSAGEVITGKHNFWLELRWTGSALCTVGLPITIEYELLDD